MKRLLEAMLFLAVGGMLSSIYWAAYTPDQPPERVCVPLYDETGLECCQ